MDEPTALAALRSVGLPAARATPIIGGWSFWTFDVDGTWIARFARDGEIAEAAQRELTLLPELAEHLSFRVPRPTHRGTWLDLPFFVYRRIPGRALSASDASPEALHMLRQMLAELHGFPVDQAAELLGTGPPLQAGGTTSRGSGPPSRSLRCRRWRRRSPTG